MSKKSSNQNDQAHRKLELEMDPTRRISSSEHERAVAIFDLLDENQFELLKALGHIIYICALTNVTFILISEISDEVMVNFFMALGPLRRNVRDYFQSDSYYGTIRTKSPSQILTIDMPGCLHDEGSELLQQRLSRELDHDTARRLFTLVCALSAKIAKKEEI